MRQDNVWIYDLARLPPKQKRPPGIDLGRHLPCPATAPKQPRTIDTLRVSDKGRIRVRYRCGSKARRANIDLARWYP